MVKLFDSEVHLDASPIWCLVHLDIMSGNLFEFKRKYIYRCSSVNRKFLQSSRTGKIRTRRVN